MMSKQQRNSNSEEITEEMIDRYIETFVNTGDPDDPEYRECVRQFLADYRASTTDQPLPESGGDDG